MTSNIDWDRADPDQRFVLSTEDGAWYELPAAELERARITDLAFLDELRGQMAATRDDDTAVEQAPSAFLSGEVLSAHRADAERAAVLEAAVEVAGFGPGNDYYISGNHRQVVVYRREGLVPWMTLVLATAPSTRFGDGAPYLR